MSGKFDGHPRAANIVKIGLLCGMMVFLAACAAKDTSPEGAVETAMNKRELVYGITVAMPDGWGIASSADAGVAQNTEINEHVAKGERVGILSIYRTGKEGNEPTGGISLFLVDAKKEFMPQENAANMTPEACEHLSQLIVQRDRELASEKKAKSPILSWSLSRETVSGKLALLQKGLAEAPTGKVNILYADIYLPNGVGLAVKAAANAEPGTEEVLRTFVDNIQVK